MPSSFVGCEGIRVDVTTAHEKPPEFTTTSPAVQCEALAWGRRFLLVVDDDEDVSLVGIQA
jgi:hypothetical protein